MDLKQHLISRNCTLLKEFRSAEDRRICLVRRPDGFAVVWRLYNRPVWAYNALISVKCPELPEVYAYTEIESGCLIEEEYIDGIPLTHIVESHRLDEHQTAAIVLRLCNALTVLHHKNMVHRDIKPENILITSSGRVVLIDLDAVSPRTSSKNRDTQLLGTVGYAAPEQYGFGHSDGRTDIFGTGVLMNVLLTGKHPAQKLTDGAFRPIVQKCIAVNVDQRYATVEELMSQLPDPRTQKCPSCGFISPGGGCIFCGIHTQKPLMRRFHKGWAIAAAAVLIALIVGLGLIKTPLLSENHAWSDPPASSPQPDFTPENSQLHEPIPSSSISPSQGTATPDSSHDFSSDSSDVSDITPEPSPEASVISLEPTSGYPSISEQPKEEYSTQDSTTVSVDSLPFFPGEPSYEITSLLYDLDGDGTAEEYYFGLLAEQAMFAPKLVVNAPSTPDSISSRKFAPAVWSINSSGTLIPVSQFASLLEDINISFYQYNGNDTLPVTQNVDPLNGIWRGATEITCSYNDTGNWIIVAHARLNEIKLTSYSNIIIRPPDTTNTISAQSVLMTEGVPVGNPFPVEFQSRNELLLGECEFYDCTAQHLDNNHIRFTVDYSGPVAQNFTIFDPPNGALFKYTNRNKTTGTRELLIFDIPEEQLRATEKITITFNCGNGSRFLLFIDTPTL